MALQLDTTTIPGRTIVYNEMVSVSVATTVDGNTTTTTTTTTTTPTAICIDYGDFISALTANIANIAIDTNNVVSLLTTISSASSNTENAILNIANSSLTIANSLIGIDTNTGIISIEANNNISKLTTINTTLYTDTENVVNMLVGVSGNLHSMNVHQETLKILANTTGLRITEPWGWLSMSSVANLAKKEGVDLTTTYKDMKNITEF
jgi:hypothetical protein